MVFSVKISLPQLQLLQGNLLFCFANVSATTSAVATTGLVIPGITFGIVPIGFYLYSAYWAVFSALVLWGAWNKRKVYSC
jgi:hypothetical protein